MKVPRFGYRWRDGFPRASAERDAFLLQVVGDNGLAGHCIATRRGAVLGQQTASLLKSLKGEDVFDREKIWQRLWDMGRMGTEIVEAVAPLEDELIIDKPYASAFWGTPLLTYLVQLQADSILVAGVSTSGCVRATAVDAITRGFRTAVIWDGVADRVQISHKAALLELWMKYTDLMSGDEAASYLHKATPDPR